MCVELEKWKKDTTPSIKKQQKNTLEVYQAWVPKDLFPTQHPASLQTQQHLDKKNGSPQG